MIKIFGNDEDEGKGKSAKSEPFSLNIVPEDDPKPAEIPAEEHLPEEPAVKDPPPLELPIEESTPPIEASPWEKIEEPAAGIAQNIFEEAEIPPLPVPEPLPLNEPDAPPLVLETLAEEESRQRETFAQTPYQPETKDEAIRNTGLALNAGIIFFGSVVFMLIIGWGADLLLNSSPWGLVGGIVLGSLIGFIQFFRISSQIFRK